MPASLDLSIFQLVVNNHPNSDPNTIVTEYYNLLTAKRIIESGARDMSSPTIDAKAIPIEPADKDATHEVKLFTENDLKCEPKDSILDDKIICCLCGNKSFTSLYKHLQNYHKCTPQNYRKICGFASNKILGSLKYETESRERGRALGNNRKQNKSSS